MSKYTEDYVLGMDAGGTKTKVTALSLTGAVLDTFEGGGMNVNSFGPALTKANLQNLLTYVAQQDPEFQHLKGLTIGAAGISNPATVLTMESGAQELQVPCRPQVIGDHEAAMAGAHLLGDGMILIAGTGSICFGKKREMIGRAGGYGHLIDDEGSGYALGRDVLSCVVRSEDGRNEPTVMREAVMHALNITELSELIAFVYDEGTTKKEIASLAPIIMKGYEAGEEAAKAVLLKAAGELTELVVAVAKKLNMEEGEVAFCGSVLQKNAVLQAMVTENLIKMLPQVKAGLPKQDAAYGAALLALQRAKREREE